MKTGDPLHIVDEVEDEIKQYALPIRERVRDFWRDYKILLVGSLLLTLWTIMTCTITGTIVRHNTEIEVEERVTHEMRGQFQSHLDWQAEQEQAAKFLTGDASRQAQIEEDAEYTAKLMSKYKTKRMKQTVLLNAWARMKSGLYPNTMKAVVSQANQFQFWNESNPVKADDYELAYALLTDLYAGKYPAGFDDKFIYGEWSENDYVLRDTWEKNSNTNYYRMPE